MEKLSLSNVSKQFESGRAAVSNVSIDVRPGAFLALLGPSGCGKTTLLRMIAGFDSPTSGAIYLGDRLLADANRLVPPEHRNMAMVFQSYALWPHMTVADNVGYPLKIRGLRGENYKRRVAAALDAVRLSDYGHRRPAELSGGQRQRVALARCIVTTPSVVLLDEPLANLDRHLRQEMEETFRDFHRQSGATMIYVTHDQAEAMALATDVAIMSEGQILQIAPPADIYAKPEGKVVGRLVGRGVILSLSLKGLEPRLLDAPTFQQAILSDNEVGYFADVLVRPEHVAIGAQGIAAVVEECVFEGERYVLKMRVCPDKFILGYSDILFKPGDQVNLTIERAWRL
ncbi:ABC transporter ATP-binding protein [Oryzifoliimicrobium ureilyticus]|uniref:ABC transporter ATP-binding protein n=1 Tax=Oryzifoliimicrobium ureilyticus TaxID=3113724 RepID=UPI0030764048